MEIIENALKNGQSTLSEFDSKKILQQYKIPVTKEIIVNSGKALESACEEIGFPIVLKGSSAEIAHKTEQGLIAIDLRNLDEAIEAFEEIQTKMNTSEKHVLVQEMVKGQRELVVGMKRDIQFGPCVMFGLGGIFTEILKDVSFRIAPLDRFNAMEMMDEIKGKKILDAVRGMEAADTQALADILIATGKLALENPDIQEIDINPLKIKNGQPIAVDALIALKT